jgi:UTP--glucose-1-phosphate uridylyltransferase
MLPVALKPLLYWALDECADAGLLRVIIVTNPHRPMIEAAARHWQGPLELEFVPQPQPRGIGHALMCARDALGGSPFAVVLTDQLFAGPNPTSIVLDSYRATRKPAVLLHDVATGVSGERVNVAQAPDATLRITDVHDGSRVQESARLAVSGRMALPGGILADAEDAERALAPWSELGIMPLLQRLAWRGDLAGVRYPGTRFDLAVPEGYHAAVSHFPSAV